MFFQGDGFLEKDIEWEDFRVSVTRGQGKVCNYILKAGGRRMSINDINEIQTGIETMTNSLVRIVETERANAGGDNRDNNRDRDADRNQERENPKDKYMRIRTMLLEEVGQEPEN